MNTQNGHIKNPDAYFKTVLKNMNLKENIKQSEIEDNEIFVEDPSICSDFLDNFDLDKEIAGRNLLGWIDMIEDQKLHAAVKSLPVEEQALLSYIFEKEMTQRELAKIYNLSHRAIGKKSKILIDKLKYFIQNGEF